MYNFDEIIERHGKRSLKWDSGKKDLLQMWVADMDFRAPPAVLKALQEAVDHGVFGYGIADDLPGTISAWMREEFGVHVEEEWICLLSGIVPALIALSHLREGPVMCHTPNYNCLLDAPLRAGKETVLSPLKNTDEKYEMDFADMEERVKGVKLFYLCNPQNPVGRVYTRDELLELSRFARKNNLIVVSDEVHCGLTFDRPHIPWFSVDEYSFERSITLIGPAKTYNIPGLPLGFAVIPNKELRGEFQKTCAALPGPGLFSVIAAKAAFAESREWKNAAVEYLRQNRDCLETRLRAALPAARLPHVEGTYLQWIDFRPLGIADPWNWLQERCGIMTSPGKIYGTDGYIRLNFGVPRARLEEAVGRIVEGVKG